MADSTTYEGCIEVAGIAFTKGDRLGAERALQAAVQLVEGVDGRGMELASTLIRLGALKREAGNLAEAEAAFVRALSVSETSLGTDHPDLVILLNDLSRLYLAQSAFEQAEPLLLRLLALKRHKGEDHPEVATVLASLAGVRQALGRHEEAEQMWRQVLEIRERTLAPNHFAIATTVERVAEACAARGKIREALQSFQRAHAIREATLGADHPSLRSSRERIADLQLQASEDRFSGEVAAVPERPRLLPGDPTAAGAPPSARLATPRDVPIAAPRDVSTVTPRDVKTPRWAAVVEAEATTRRSGRFDEAILMPPNEASLPTVTTPHVEPSQYLDVLMDIKSELDDTPTEQPSASRVGAMASIALFLRERRTAALLGAAAVVVPLVVMAAAAARSDSGSRWVEQPAVAPAVRTETPLVTTAVVEGPSSPSTETAKAVSANGTKSGSRERSDERRSDERNASESAVAAIPTVQRPTVGRLDSVVRSINVAVPPVEPFATKLAGALDVSYANSSDVAPTAAQRPRIIGATPVPKYPSRLLVQGEGGEVVVRFDVDTTGKPVMSSFGVIGSPHALLTAAVREVIPTMRFEPARTAWPESKAIVDRVEMVFKFNTARSRD